MAAAAEARRHAAQVVEGLRRLYPTANCALLHGDAFQLLIATILSAQCTDERVNQVTPLLFARYPRPADLAAAPLAEIEKLVQSTGFFRNKAKNIQACCRQLVERHGGEVPRDLPSLTALPGVGRKTANVVLGSAYGLATGVVVDTHVGRLSRRLGLTRHDDPEKVERDLMTVLPADEWIAFSHRMIFHGRQICGARRPQCDVCPFLDFCPRIGVPAAKSPAKALAADATRPADSQRPKRRAKSGSGGRASAAGGESRATHSSRRRSGG